MDICFYRIISFKAQWLVSFVQMELNFINGTRGSKQRAVKYKADRYESFLSLDTLDQVLRLSKYVSFLRSGTRGALADQLGTDRCSNKECETHPKQ